jgi:hypothetical protein
MYLSRKMNANAASEVTPLSKKKYCKKTGFIDASKIDILPIILIVIAYERNASRLFERDGYLVQSS